jgi:hypothetical protein
MLMWTAAATATTALLMVIVIQVFTIVLTTRPPMVTRWFNGLFAIGQQAIFASIAMGISGYTLYITQNERAPARAGTSQAAPAPRPFYTEPASAPEPKLPSDLRAAVAAASESPKRRK